MQKLLFYGGLATWLLAAFPGWAQGQADPNPAEKTDTTAREPNKFIVLPVAFYTPETSLSFGAVGVYTFRFRQEADSTFPSQVQPAAAYTLLNQVLLYAPFRLYWQQERYLAYGELGYYRYNYLFFGVGNDQDPDFEELYGVDFPRIQVNLLRLLTPLGRRRPDGRREMLYGGLRYWYENYQMTEFDAEGQLVTGEVPGGAGGTTSALGLIFNYDTRDKIFFPRKGSFVEGFVETYRAGLGSDFRYDRLSLDASRYLTNRFGHVLAVNLYGVLTWGDPPFNQMALLGGPRKMRGFYLGRFRENHLLLAQTEYRARVYKRFGAVAFANYGGVAPTLGDFQLDQMRFTAGAGLRFVLDVPRELNLRLDYGYGRFGSNFYVTIGEAF